MASINTSTTDVPRIRKLDEVVVNRIAAGEVIQRPSNAIKELIENSLDARSKSIQVTINSGGLKLLQIQDDGCGIRREDMAIVCERFTTSKLSTFGDLKKISTYGFRGEALASISHIAHLTITTKTQDSPCAYKAKYEDGKLVPLVAGQSADPKPCAGNKGTLIAAEDLFFNVPLRRNALKNPSEEQTKIVEVVSRYAIHNSGVNFTLKKVGENIAIVRTNASASVQENIKAIYGTAVARELLELHHEDDKLGFKVAGFVSNANYSMKKCVFLLFINHRLVESSSLRRALDAVYLNYLPKEKHPFMYLSLEISPENIDVNVHPTKHEVNFLHEDMIVDSIQKVLETKLLGCNESRHYYMQNLLPKMVAAAVEQPISAILSEPAKKSDAESAKKVYAHQLVRTDARERTLQAFFSPASSPASSRKGVSNPVTGTLQEQALAGSREGDAYCPVRASAVLSDDWAAKPSSFELGDDSFLDSGHHAYSNVTGDSSNSCLPSPSSLISTDVIAVPVVSHGAEKTRMGELSAGDSGFVSATGQTSCITDTDFLTSPQRDLPSPIIVDVDSKEEKISSKTIKRKRSPESSSGHPKVALVPRRQIKLTSVRNLREKVDDDEHTGLKSLLEDHKFVGCVNRSLCLVQHLTKLYLVNTELLSQELFYQIMLCNFGNFGFIDLSSPAPIYELAILALECPDSGWSEEDGSKVELASYVKELLISRAEMLLDYFSMEISPNGDLLTLPLLLEKQTPNMNGLPMFILRLATEVDWDSEEGCFDTFCRECSRFYAMGPDPLGEDTEDAVHDETEEPSGESGNWRWTIEHVLWPALRTSLIPPKSFSENGTFLEVANLPDLYKVFERC